MILPADPEDKAYKEMQVLACYLLEQLGGRIRIPFKDLVEADWKNKVIVISDLDFVTDSWIVKVVTREDSQ